MHVLCVPGCSNKIFYRVLANLHFKVDLFSRSRQMKYLFWPFFFWSKNLVSSECFFCVGRKVGISLWRTKWSNLKPSRTEVKKINQSVGAEILQFFVRLLLLSRNRRLAKRRNGSEKYFRREKEAVWFLNKHSSV